MKKLSRILMPAVLVLMLVILSGCSSKSITSLCDWSIQENSDTNDYSLFFGLLDDKDKYMAADVMADVRIEDESGKEIYSNTLSISEDDFDYYTSEAYGTRYLAEVRIPESDITAGSSSSGTVYMTVYNKDIGLTFDEVNFSASYCLPVADTLLSAEVPVDVNVIDFDGSVASEFRINDVSYTNDETNTSMDITVSGTKLSGSSSLSDVITYKIYDSQGYVVDSGTLFVDSVSAGESFRSDIYFYNANPGESYTIGFESYDWSY